MMNDLVATTLLKLDKTYPFNHCFGTVSFIYQDEDKVVYLFN